MQVATLFRETATLLGASMEAQDPSGTESQALKLWVGSVNSTYGVIINLPIFRKKYNVSVYRSVTECKYAWQVIKTPMVNGERCQS